MSDVPERLLKEQEAAEFLGYSKCSMQVLRCRGGGPAFVRLGGKRAIRYRMSDLLQYIGRSVSSTSEY